MDNIGTWKLLWHILPVRSVAEIVILSFSCDQLNDADESAMKQKAGPKTYLLKMALVMFYCSKCDATKGPGVNHKVTYWPHHYFYTQRYTDLPTPN